MSVLRSPVLATFCRILLGLAFLYAAVPKLEQPPDFAKEVASYKILPPQAVNAVAIFLPWVELAVGLALFAGVGARGAGGLAGLMLVVFIAAISIRLGRGETSFECGCAGVGSSLADQVPYVSTALRSFYGSTDPWMTIVRDVFLLLLSLPVMLAGGDAAPVRTGRPATVRRPPATPRRGT